MQVPITQIVLPENVRPLDEERVLALADSMRLVGQLVPLIVHEAEQGYALVAGFHRLAAAVSAGLGTVEVSVRDAQSEHLDRAVENVARAQLTPAEEYEAIRRCLDHGLTQDGAAQALAISKQRVTARLKLGELPAEVRARIGVDWPMGLADLLVDQIKPVSTALLDAVCSLLMEDPAFEADLQRDARWTLARNTTELRRRRAFIVAMGALDYDSLTALADGREWKAVYGYTPRKPLREQAQAICDWYGGDKQPARYECKVGPSQEDLDVLRAANCLLEFGRDGWYSPFVIDREAFKVTVEAMVARAFADGPPKKKAVGGGRQGELRAKTERTPTDEERLRHQRALRELTTQAHGVNLDVGRALLDGLAVVDVSMDVARFFVGAVLDASDGSRETLAERLADNGVRLVLEQFREDVTKVRKDGTRGAVKFDYGDAHREDSRKWLRTFINGAKTPEELFGRALVVIAMQRYAIRDVVPTAQRHHKEYFPTEKQLEKLCKAHLPASWKALRKAIDAEIVDHHRRHDALVEEARAAVTAARAAQAKPEPEAPAEDGTVCRLCGEPVVEDDETWVDPDDGELTHYQCAEALGWTEAGAVAGEVMGE